MCFLLSFLPGCHRVSRNVPSTLKSLNQYSLSHFYPPSPTPSYWAVSIKCIITKFVSCKVMIFFLFTMKILILSGLLTTCDSDTLRIWIHRFVNLGKTWGLINGLLICMLSWIFGFTLSFVKTDNHIFFVYPRGFPPVYPIVHHKYPPEVAGFTILMENSSRRYFELFHVLPLNIVISQARTSSAWFNESQDVHL